jgi:hypothetical protein
MSRLNILRVSSLITTSSSDTSECLCRLHGENADADAAISNICVCIMRLSLLGIRIRIMRLLSAPAQLLNDVIICYTHMRYWACWFILIGYILFNKNASISKTFILGTSIIEIP